MQMVWTLILALAPIRVRVGKHCGNKIEKYDRII